MFKSFNKDSEICRSSSHFENSVSKSCKSLLVISIDCLICLISLSNTASFTSVEADSFLIISSIWYFMSTFWFSKLVKLCFLSINWEVSIDIWLLFSFILLIVLLSSSEALISSRSKLSFLSFATWAKDLSCSDRFINFPE